LHIGLVSWFLSILSLRGRLNLGNKILSHIYLNLFRTELAGFRTTARQLNRGKRAQGPHQHMSFLVAKALFQRLINRRTFRGDFSDHRVALVR
jgi:hypothetical protein